MTELKTISLFSGAGGLDIGFERAGFNICVAVESDPACCDTLRANRDKFMPGMILIEKDIQSISPSDILQKAGLKPLEVSLVIGGPPCQPFSLAGNRKGLDDPRGSLLKAFIKVVRAALPVAFVMENVKGLLNWDKGRAREMLVAELEKPIEYEGRTYCYKVNYDLLNASDFGVPQFRERVFFVGNRLGKEFKFPEPTHFDIKNRPISNGDKPLATVWDAIGDLPEPQQPSDVAVRVSKSIKGRIANHGY